MCGATLFSFVYYIRSPMACKQTNYKLIQQNRQKYLSLQEMTLCFIVHFTAKVGVHCGSRGQWCV